MQEPNNVCHIQYPTHCVFLSEHKESGQIHAFKYDRVHCDYCIFERDDIDGASDYIFTALPSHHWGFQEDQ